MSLLSFIIKSRKTWIKLGEIPWVYFYFLSSFFPLLLFFFASLSCLLAWVTEYGRKKQKEVKKSKQQLGFSVLEFCTFELELFFVFYKYSFEIWILSSMLEKETHHSFLAPYITLCEVFSQANTLAGGVLLFAICNRSLFMYQLPISSESWSLFYPPSLVLIRSWRSVVDVCKFIFIQLQLVTNNWRWARSAC